MTIEKLDKRSKAISMLIRKEDWAKHESVQHLNEALQILAELNNNVDKIEKEINIISQNISDGTSLFVDEMTRFNEYLHYKANEKQKVLKDIMKVDGVCQKLRANILKMESKVKVFRDKNKICKAEKEKLVDRNIQNGLDEVVLVKHFKLSNGENFHEY